MFKIHSRIGQFERRTSLKTWVSHIAYNAGLDWLDQKANGERESFDDLPEECTESDPESELLQDERLEQLKAGIRALPLDLKVLTLLADYLEIPYTVLTRIIGLEPPKGSAKGTFQLYWIWLLLILVR